MYFVFVDSIVIVWDYFNNIPKIIRIFLTISEDFLKTDLFKYYPKIKKKSSPEIDKVVDFIKDFLKGEIKKIDIGILYLEKLSLFQKRVLLKVYEIPIGYVTTYKIIARSIKKPRSYRMVGRALATNPFPLIIPCHRVIKSDFTIGGYEGGIEMKKKLLLNEGIKIKNNKVINPKLWKF